MSALLALQSFNHLLALIFYMGVVCLPYKTDYWKNDNTWTYHPIMHKIRIIPDQFAFLWRHYHIPSVK